jgi:hypothetical protein
VIDIDQVVGGIGEERLPTMGAGPSRGRVGRRDELGLPERLEILTEFPISAADKIMRRALRDMIEAKLRREMSV